MKCFEINDCTGNECKICKCYGCDCEDLEDSMAFEYRPKYVEKEDTMKFYTAKIKFRGKKHCNYCPLCNEEDNCRLQNDQEFDSFAEQMENCPLIIGE